MALWSRRRADPAVPVAAGERLLASAALIHGGAVGGTRLALYVPDDAAAGWQRIAWEDVHDGSWDSEIEALVVTVAGGSVHRLRLDEPARFLQLFRERVTSSVVLQRHVPISGRRGVRVVVRRSGDGTLFVTDALDAGLDPADPSVAAAVGAARGDIAAEVGLATP